MADLYRSRPIRQSQDASPCRESMSRAPSSPVNIAVLTVSDTRTRSRRQIGRHARRADRRGRPSRRRSAASSRTTRRRSSRSSAAWIADPAIDVVISTGGTGVTGRDVTPEAFQAVYEKEIAGFGELFRWLSYQKIGTSTIQSRATAGVAGGTYLFALPGSPGACRDGWEDIIEHQLDNRFRPCNLVELMPRLQEHLARRAADAQRRDRRRHHRHRRASRRKADRRRRGRSRSVSASACSLDQRTRAKRPRGSARPAPQADQPVAAIRRPGRTRHRGRRARGTPRRYAPAAIAGNVRADEHRRSRRQRAEGARHAPAEIAAALPACTRGGPPGAARRAARSGVTPDMAAPAPVARQAPQQPRRRQPAIEAQRRAASPMPAARRRLTAAEPRRAQEDDEMAAGASAQP